MLINNFLLINHSVTILSMKCQILFNFRMLRDCSVARRRQHGVPKMVLFGLNTAAGTCRSLGDVSFGLVPILARCRRHRCAFVRPMLLVLCLRLTWDDWWQLPCLRHLCRSLSVGHYRQRLVQVEVGPRRRCCVSTLVKVGTFGQGNVYRVEVVGLHFFRLVQNVTVKLVISVIRCRVLTGGLAKLRMICVHQGGQSVTLLWETRHPCFFSLGNRAVSFRGKSTPSYPDVRICRNSGNHQWCPLFVLNDASTMSLKSAGIYLDRGIVVIPVFNNDWTAQASRNRKMLCVWLLEALEHGWDIALHLESCVSFSDPSPKLLLLHLFVGSRAAARADRVRV